MTFIFTKDNRHHVCAEHRPDEVGDKVLAHVRLKHQAVEDPSASQIQIRTNARQYLLSAHVTEKTRITAASTSPVKGNHQLPHMLSVCLTNPRDQNTKNSLSTL